jgi:PEP-CTERM motif
MKHYLMGGVAALGAVLSVPAAAVTPVIPSVVIACSAGNISPAASDCSGFYAGNLLGGANDKVAAQAGGLSEVGFTWDQNWSAVNKIDSLGGATSVNFLTSFGKKVFGETIIGIHFGGGAWPRNIRPDGGATAFYKFDAGKSGLESIDLNLSSSSGFVLYSTEGGVVPEPATWAMLIAGFGLVGSVMRRRRGVASVSA